MNVKTFIQAAIEANHTRNITDGHKINMDEIMNNREGIVTIYGFNLIDSHEYGLLAPVDIGNGEWMYATSELRNILIAISKESKLSDVNKEFKENPVKITFTKIKGKEHDFYRIIKVE